MLPRQTWKRRDSLAQKPKAMSKRQFEKEKRKRVLTVCFFTVTLAWIFLYSVTAAGALISLAVAFSKMGVALHLYVTFSPLPSRLFALVNPVIFVIVNRKFQAPFWRLQECVCTSHRITDNVDP